MSSMSSHEGEQEHTSVSFDVVLSDDLLEKTLSLLPISSIRSASLVSKRWHAVVHRPWAVIPPLQTSLFFMLADHADRPVDGHAYDPSLRRWSTARLDSIEEEFWDVAASSGLVCIMIGRNATKGRLFVCNPVTGDRKQLPCNPLLNLRNPSSVAMSVDQHTHSYTVVVISCRECNVQKWDVSAHVYESTTQTWAVELSKTMPWCEHKSVICNGVLYCLFNGSIFDEEFNLLTYDLASRPASKSFGSIAVPVPSSLLTPLFLILSPMLSNPWLMNLREKLVMVAMIQIVDRPYVVVGLAIWVLGKEGWQKVAQITLGQIRERFGDKYYTLYSCGAGDFVYVHCCTSSHVLIFDMVQKRWEWSKRCSIDIKNDWKPCLTGFCFEPNFKINC